MLLLLLLGNYLIAILLLSHWKGDNFPLMMVKPWFLYSRLPYQQGAVNMVLYFRSKEEKGGERRCWLKCSLLVKAEILQSGGSVVPGKMQTSHPGLGSYSVVW